MFEKVNYNEYNELKIDLHEIVALPVDWLIRVAVKLGSKQIALVGYFQEQEAEEVLALQNFHHNLRR